MNTTRTNLKYGGMNVIIGGVYVVGSSLALQYALNVTPSYCCTGEIRLSNMIKETEKQLK